MKIGQTAIKVSPKRHPVIYNWIHRKWDKIKAAYEKAREGQKYWMPESKLPTYTFPTDQWEKIKKELKKDVDQIKFCFDNTQAGIFILKLKSTEQKK